MAPAALATGVTELDFDDIVLGGTVPTPIDSYDAFSLLNWGVDSYDTLSGYGNTDFADYLPTDSDSKYLITVRTMAEIELTDPAAAGVYVLGFDVLPFVALDGAFFQGSTTTPTTPEKFTVKGFDGETQVGETVEVVFLDGGGLGADFAPPFSLYEVALGWTQPVTRLEFEVFAYGDALNPRFLLDNLSYTVAPIPLPAPVLLLASALVLLARFARTGRKF